MFKKKNTNRKEKKKAKQILRKKLYSTNVNDNSNVLYPRKTLCNQTMLTIETNFDNSKLETINDKNDCDNNLGDEYNIQFMFTARNKWRNNKKEITFNNINDKHEILEIREDLKIYLYSKVERKSKSKLIYQYHFDTYNDNDYKNAKIILFIGKTGDGKTTAINAFFNIIKGIKREDKYRYILIKEQKKAKGQAESQTDGLHIYYIKDKDNRPIIIIDSQGFGDTRGKEYDELINEAFEYAFKNIIDHINTVCFIGKSSEARLDILVKYIFSCATSLFSDNVTRNFIFLNTFANRSTMKEGPEFVKSIESDSKFKEIIKKMDKKWWYAAESINILDNDIDKLTLYSFQQLNELYEEKIINSNAISLNRSYEIINSRNRIKNVIKDLISKYKNIKTEKQRIPEIDKKINEYSNKINDINWRINNKKDEIRDIYIPNLSNELSIIESRRDQKINALDNEYVEKTVRRLKYVGGNHTICKKCERNCHENCDCFGAFVNRCTVFSMFGGCESCGHEKDNHVLHSSSKYVDETERNKVNNYSKIQKVRDNYWEERDRIYEKYNRKMNEKERKENELTKLNNEKSQLNSQQNSYSNEKTKINDKIQKLNMELTLVILELKKIARKIKDIGMNTFHSEIENEYIDSLISRLEMIGEKTNEIVKLKENKKYIDIFMAIENIVEDDLIQFGVDYYFESDPLKSLIK